MKEIKIDAAKLHYSTLNRKIRLLINDGYTRIFLENVYGQRFTAAGLKEKNIEIIINGVAGNDTGCFMDGPIIYVNGSCQDGVGNTMNSGKIIVNGNSGDIAGHSMRGGEIYIKGNAGYRVGIHMKEYKTFYPVIVIGGTSKDFLGEYMAGGLIIVLNLEEKKRIAGELAGTGMHGGQIFLRGQIDPGTVGKEVRIFKEDKIEKILAYLINFSHYFNIPVREITNREFIKLIPVSKRPYGRIYCY